MRSLTFALAAALICAACGGKSPEEKLLKSVDPAMSWVPALQMTAEKWTANSVPASFASSAAGAAQKEFEKAQNEISKSKANEELRRRLTADFRQANDFAGRLDHAAQSNDPGSVPAAARFLAPVKSDLDAIQKQYGGGS